MPFVFDKNAFTGPQQSPLGQLLTSMFGTAAPVAAKAFEDQKEDERFQAALAQRQKQFDREEVRYQEEQFRQNEGRKAFAGALTDTLVGPEMKPRNQAGAVAGAAMGGPVAGAVAQGSLNHLGKYQQDFNQRRDRMQRFLAGMDPQYAAVAANAYHAQEEKAKHQSFSNHAAEILANGLMGMQRQGIQGPGTRGGTAAGEADPALEAERQMFAQNTQVAIQALKSGQVKDPQGMLETFAQGQAHLDQMQRSHQQAMNQHATYSQVNEGLKQQLMELMQLNTMHGGEAVSPDYIAYLEDRISENDSLLSDRSMNLDTPTKEFQQRWHSANSIYRPKMMNKADDVSKDVELALKHIDQEEDRALKDLARLDKDLEVGRITQDQYNAGRSQIDAAIQNSRATREELLNESATRSEMDSPNQVGPPTTGSASTPGQADPGGGPPDPNELAQGVAVLIADGNVEGAIASLGAPKDKGGQALSPEEVNKVMELAEPIAQQIAKERTESGSATLRGEVQGLAESKSQADKIAKTLEQEYHIGVPKDRDSWIKAMELLQTRSEEEGKKTRTVTRGRLEPVDVPQETHEKRVVDDAVKLLRQYGALKKYAPATREELKRIFGTR